MKRIKQLLASIIISVMLLSCSTPQGALNLWQTNMNCNGKLDDWKTPLRFATNRVQYDISNNKDTLFICMKMMDQLLNNKVMMNGLKLWIDTTAKEKDKMCISIMPNKAKPKEIKIGGKPDKSDTTNSKLKYISDVNEIDVKGLISIPNGKLALNNKYGVKLGVGLDEFNNLTYEFAIPYKCISQKAITDMDTNKVLALGVEIDGIKGSGSSQSGGGPMGGGGDGPPPPMGGGGPGFGGDGPMPGGPPPDMMRMEDELNDLYTNIKIWQNIKLKVK